MMKLSQREKVLAVFKDGRRTFTQKNVVSSTGLRKEAVSKRICFLKSKGIISVAPRRKGDKGLRYKKVNPARALMYQKKEAYKRFQRWMNRAVRDFDLDSDTITTFATKYQAEKL